MDNKNSSLPENEMESFGYQTQLKRTMGGLTSFALAFSMVTITTTIFSQLTYGIITSGVMSVWVWPIVTIGVLLIALLYGQLATRMPITGFAYQWMSRLTSPHYGWLTGWSAMMATICGVVVISNALTTFVTPALGLAVTQTNLLIVACVCIVIAAVLNIVGIKITTLVNNVGAFIELFGTLLIGVIVLVIALAHHTHSLSYLFSTAGMSGSHASFTSFSMAALLPIWTLMGWEGAADLAEETKDPRRVIPKMMFRAVLVSGLGAFLVVIALTLATPNMHEMLNATVPVLYILKSVFGSWISPLLYVIVIIAMFAALLANVAVATRMMYSLSRDNMLPFSGFLKKISPKLKTPANAIIVIGVIALVVNVAGGGLLTLFAAIVSIAYYLVYLSTIAGSLYAIKKGRMPSLPSGYFNMGKWYVPVAIVALIYIAAAIIMLTVPTANQINGEAVLGGLVLGGIWYALRLRRKIKLHEAGPPDMPTKIMDQERSKTL